MMILKILGWLVIAVLAVIVTVLLVYVVAAIGMAFVSVFLMLLAYLKGGKEGLRRHNERMKEQANK